MSDVGLFDISRNARALGTWTWMAVGSLSEDTQLGVWRRIRGYLEKRIRTTSCLFRPLTKRCISQRDNRLLRQTEDRYHCSIILPPQRNEAARASKTSKIVIFIFHVLDRYLAKSQTQFSLTSSRGTTDYLTVTWTESITQCHWLFD